MKGFLVRNIYVVLMLLFFMLVFLIIPFFGSDVYQGYKCFDIVNESEFRYFTLNDVQIKWNENATVKQTWTARLQQIGREANETALLVIAYNYSSSSAVIDAVKVFNFNEVVCPENVGKIAEDMPR